MTKLKLVVRKAQEGDLEAINGLTDDLHRYLAGLYGLELSVKELEEEHFDRDELDNVYVVEDAGIGVVSYMSFSKSRDEWAGPHYSLEHLIVREEYRNAGVAEMLFDILLEKARLEGMNIVTGTLARNERALRFYERMGFKPLTIGLLLDLKKRIYKPSNSS